MRSKFLLLGLLLLTGGLAVGEDILFLKNGEKRLGTITDIEGHNFRLRVSLDEKNPAITASVSIRRSDVIFTEFFFDPAVENKIKASTLAQLDELIQLWKKYEPFLGIQKSPAAKVGLACADLLLRSGDAGQAGQSLKLFALIESGAWFEADRMSAKQGRLRAMVATGDAAQAVVEAGELAKSSEDPTVLIEAKYILAEAAAKALRQLVEDNPRWQEDVYIRPEHERLCNECLDLYLYPSLFFGSERESAARGLWGSVGIYEFLGERARAMEVCRDIVAIYPGTKFSKPAKDFIAQLPEEVTKRDAEQEAAAEL